MMLQRRLASYTIPRAAARSSSISVARRSIVLANNATKPETAPSPLLHRSFSDASIQKKEVKNPDMMCRQCEQTQDHFACTTVGVCGKSPETSVSSSYISD